MHLITLQEWTTAQLEAIIDTSIHINQHSLHDEAISTGLLRFARNDRFTFHKGVYL